MPSSTAPPLSLFRLLRDRVGGAARIRGRFTADDLRQDLARADNVHLATALPHAALLDAAARCGALLRAHGATLGASGLHVVRPVVDEIVTWASDVDRKGSLALLTDQAGMGKTVVLLDTLLALEQRGFSVLAIKADLQLSGIASHEELKSRLQLPDSVERVIAALSANGTVAVLLDQVDALSLSMAHDQRALDVVLDLVARLRTLPGVAIVVSCRTFDRSNDPRLRSLHIDKVFAVQGLDDTQVEGVVEGLNVSYASLAPATRVLLCVPLHLHLFAQLPRVESGPISGRDIASLQDLYALLWRDVILVPVAHGPSEADRAEALYAITDHMHGVQRTLVPQSLFHDPVRAHLAGAVRWLASAGILLPGQDSWAFMHQTFFDYCYARRFVETGRRLAAEIRAGDQGLFVRPLLAQVLGYLRGSDPDAYLQELCDLCTGEGLRYHLQNLVWRWFGALPDPSDSEWTLARRWLVNEVLRPRLLSAIAGNPAWFARLRGPTLQHLLGVNDASLDAEILPYLASLLPTAQAEVVAIIQPYAERGARWQQRIGWLLSRMRTGHTAEAVALIERMLQVDPTFGPDHFVFRFLDSIAEAHPAAACRLLKLLCERILDNHLAERAMTNAPTYFPLDGPLEALNTGTLDQALKSIVHADPETFLGAMLPWLERAVSLAEGSIRSAAPRVLWFPRDDLSYGWFGGPYVAQQLLINAIVDALTDLVQRDRTMFWDMARCLDARPTWTPQHLLALVYRNVATHVPDEALTFLLADRRRLALGDFEGYDTRALIEALHPYLSGDQRLQLEGYVLAYNPLHQVGGLVGLRSWGIDQLFLLQSLPGQALTPSGGHRLRELERKFPGQRASPTRIVPVGGMVESPIEREATAQMSDRAWKRAMRKYHGGTTHREFLKGGAHELAGSLQEQAKVDPQRFYRLAMQVPSDTEPAYIMALVRGLAQADAPAARFFDVVRHFGTRTEDEIRRTIIHELDQRTEQGEVLPDDLVDLLGRLARDDAGSLRENDADPFTAAINSVSGSALLALAQALSLRGTPEARERIWSLLKETTTSTSPALRAAALEPLLREWSSDRDRAVDIYERLLDGYPAVRRTHYAQEFLYYGLYSHFGHLAPYIRAQMDEGEERHQQRGAEIACIASVSLEGINIQDTQVVRRMAGEVILGRAAWRRGAAHVYAHNIARDNSDTCARELLGLLDDEDKQVRRHIGEIFSQLDDSQRLFD